MQYDWLYGFPIHCDPDVQSDWVVAAREADPAAVELTVLEAEQFMAASYVVRIAHEKFFCVLKAAFGVNTKDNSPAGWRRTVIRILRKWRQPAAREKLLYLVPRSSLGAFRDPEDYPEFWTDEYFRAAYAEGHNVCLLAQIKRFLDPTVDTFEWLKDLDEEMETVYRFYLNVGALTLWRLVYQPMDAVQAKGEAAPALADPSSLTEQLRAKTAETGALRQGVRRLEQERKRQREKARRQERAERELLSQARGEVAAARRVLNDRRQAMHRELAERARRHQAELDRYRRELDGARQEFLRALGERRWGFLRGRRVQVDGGDARENRLLVESLGGTWTTDEPELVLDGTGGALAVEQGLHGAILADLQIRCDGLHRRKRRRPGIAAAAFQVYADGVPVFEQHRVVCCGPAAGSLMAEYGAVVMALSWLLGAGPAPGSRVEVWSDCRDFVRAVGGDRPAGLVRGCVQLDGKVRRLVRGLEKAGCVVVFRQVRREFVDAEDRLCDLAYREAVWYHRPEAGGRSVALAEFLVGVG